MMCKIRDLKVERSRARRDIPTDTTQAAEKRRKVGKEEYRRVVQHVAEKGEKRKGEDTDKTYNKEIKIQKR